MPQFSLHYGIAEADRCQGTVIVIDVLRAFTTAAFAFASGVEQIFLVSTAEEAFSLRQKNPDWILVGENKGRKIEGFDFGNSPEAMARENLTGKTLVLRSSSGTQGVVGATQADRIYLGSLVVAQSTTQRILSEKSPHVSILAMGSVGGADGPEDIACRDYLHSCFLGKPLAHSEIQKRVIESPAGQQALDPRIDFKTPGDLDCACRIDCFGFSMPVTRERNFLIARKA